MMLNYFNILLCCMIFFFGLINGQAFFCPNTTSYSPNSTYSSNLKALLSSLSSNSSSPNGFYNSTEGQVGSDITYGLFLCRGDVSPDDCQNCVSTVTKEITSENYCSNGKIAVLWVDQCLVRYSNEPISGSISYTWFNTQNVSDPQRFLSHLFLSLLENVLNELPTMAANVNNSSGKKFATKEANFSSSERVYTFAQCVPDLSISSCENCLRTAIWNLSSVGAKGSRVLAPSCTLRYELYPFYNVTAFAPPPAPPVRGSPPPSSPGSTGSDRGKGGISSGVIAAIVVPIAVSILLFIFGFCWLRHRASREFNFVEDTTDADEISTAESLQYQLNIIRAATTNFSTDNKIGEGGFGVVYKVKVNFLMDKR
ncbi:cysteine-rich receptor-like protein kinase 10 [Lycium ferocissimum]|uniref:cysteine-rich receptor-like protein kinase 10 n=1 Tax=Lycium ferocissimum TaxID=112874 RepID=UPI002814A4FC|nr:cysteine-rich receptor-like protein kinase 10 [Lycium ferocissimum]